MLEIINNKIRLTRGDTMRLSISLQNSDGEPIVLSPTDKLYFRLKRNAKIEEMLIEHLGDSEQMLIELNENDTKDIPFGKYKYEIEVVYEGDHYTIIENEDFTIGEELENHE